MTICLFEFQENGRAAGFDIDLIRAVAEVMDFEVEIRLDAWGKLQEDLKTGKSTFGGYLYARSGQAFRFRCRMPWFPRCADRLSIRSFADLAGKEVIVQVPTRCMKFSNGRESHRESFPYRARRRRCGDLPPTRCGVDASKPRPARLTSLGSARPFPPIPTRRYGFAVREGNLPLVYNRMKMKILKATGKYREIYDRWFGV